MTLGGLIMAKKRKSKTSKLFALIAKNDEGENETVMVSTMSFLRRNAKVAATAAMADQGSIKRIPGFQLGIQMIESADYSAEAGEVEDF
jgi:hypothetical protein